ncbi:MAG: thioredoxin family protein [Fuerstiella sp.]
MTVAAVATMFTACFLAAPDMDRAKESDGMVLDSQMPAEQVTHQWLTSYDDARQLAARNNLPLLLHFDATWCGACRQMESAVLNKPEVTRLLGKQIVGVRIDADRYKELIAEYGISTLPTEIVVQPDGSRGERLVGAVSLSQYVARLRRIDDAGRSAVADSKSESPADAANVRSCLIVRHDGKMVGMGGFSPVALVSQRQWIKGSDQFVASHEGVEYFLQSAAEVEMFNAAPEEYIPKLHGCDLVELHLENRATTGAIEYGAFYKGKVFFFSSMENRSRFENNPTWFLGAMADAGTTNDEMFPFLNVGSVDN